MIFLDRGDEIVVPLGLVMGGDNGTWYFGGKSADRLWHKSALGIIIEGGEFVSHRLRCYSVLTTEILTLQ